MNKLLNYNIYSTENGQLTGKPIIVCIHGFAGNSAMFGKQVLRLRENYDFITIDLPGHGRSETNLREMEISYTSVTNEILKVLDYLGIKKAQFMGTSLGTLIIKHIIVYHSERVDKSVLIGAIGRCPWYYMFAINIGKILLRLLPLSICGYIVTKLFMPSKVSNKIRKLFLSSCLKMKKKELLSLMTLVTKFKQLNKIYLKKIKGGKINTDNILYISGDRDLICLPTIILEMQNFQNSYILNGCGHICNYDKPKEVNNLIKTFI